MVKEKVYAFTVIGDTSVSFFHWAGSHGRELETKLWVIYPGEFLRQCIFQHYLEIHSIGEEVTIMFLMKCHIPSYCSPEYLVLWLPQVVQSVFINSSKQKPYMEILAIEHEQTNIVSSTICSSETNDVDCLRTFQAHTKPWETAVFWATYTKHIISIHEKSFKKIMMRENNLSNDGCYIFKEQFIGNKAFKRWCSVYREEHGLPY